MALNLSILDHSKWPLTEGREVRSPHRILATALADARSTMDCSRGHSVVASLIVFSLGTLLTRSAGCVVNDLADQKLDGHVKRTALRPLATGEIVSRDAIEFMVFCYLSRLG